ncbi:MAG: twin-arginine translocase TatA/TatE family subunit [Halobacteriota archaeon]
MTMPLFIGGLGPPELLLIAGVFILLFGASKLPKLARSMGTATGEFKKGREEVEDELEEIRSGGQVAADESNVDEDAEPEIETGSDADTELDSEPDAERSGA